MRGLVTFLWLLCSRIPVTAWSLPMRTTRVSSLVVLQGKSLSRRYTTSIQRHPSRAPFQLFQISSLTESNEKSVDISPLVKATSKRLQRLSWFSWWSQMILTTISTTILLFAASVVRSGSRTAASTGTPSFFLSGIAVVLSAVSIVWTWGNGARLSRRLLRPTTLSSPEQHIQAAKLIRRAVQVQVSINMLGLLGTLLAAEEIVGSLAIKVLTTFGVGATNLYNAPLMGLQPLDILVVQANTNTLLAQFISLATSLLLTEQIRSLDPPSTLELPRKNNNGR